MFWRDPGANVWLASKPFDQSVMLFRIAQISADVQRQLVKLQARDQDQVGKITRNRFVGNNQYVIAGTRVPTEIIWEFHTSGYSAESILREYPDLTLEDVNKAIEFESERLAG